MKGLCIYIFIFCFSQLVLLGQSEKYFVKVFGEIPYNDNGIAVMQTTNRSYMIGGVTAKMIDINWSRALIYLIDKQGNLVREKIYEDSNLIYSNFKAIVELNENQIICAGERRNLDDSTWYNNVVMIDTLCDIIWQKQVGDGKIDRVAYSIKPTLTGGFVAVGSALDSLGYYDASIILMDSFGNMVWDTLMGQVEHHELFKKVIQMPDSSFAIIGGYDFLFDQGWAWFIIMDKNKKIVMDKKISILNRTIISDFYITSDNNYIICGSEEGTPEAYDNIIVFKMDTLGNIKWYKIIKDFYNAGYSSFAQKIYQLSDKGFIVAGSIYTGTAKAREALLSRLDSNGNELWRRTYGIYPGQHDYAYDMVPTSDGGYVMTGRAETPTDVDVLLIKTNCDGFTGPPKAAIEKTINYNEVHFTNRSDSAVKYQWYFGDGDSLRYNYDKSWKDIWGYDRPDTLTHVYQDSGTYILKLIAYACDESDTLTDTLHVSLPVGIDKSKIHSPANVPFSIFTVPSGEQVILSTLNGGDFNNAEIRVHDITGRLVRNYTLSGNSGTYFLSTEGIKQGVYIFGLYRNGEFAGARKGAVW